jgi:GntR family transcriptional regulator / MocR family aminotransferase
MERDWSTSSLDLALPFDAGSGRRESLERGLREAILDGRLPPGARIPSTRALARDLGYARGTVAEAYAQLVAEGYLLARQGSGTMVAPVAAPAALPDAPPTPARPLVDFRSGTPDLSSFPRSLWLAAARRALRAAPDEAFGYGDPRGRPELRRALATYLGRARGVRSTAEQIVVCGGFAQALGVLCGALRHRGVSSVALEEPGLPDHRAIAANAGLTVHSITVDAEGPCVDELALHAPGAVVVTPAHHCVLGATMAPSRRSAIVRWARDADAIVVEDDYDGEFRYGRQPVGALQGLDPERVVYAGTASKTLAPGLRLAWLVVPPGLLDPVMKAKRLADRHTASLDQLTLAELIESGAFDRHVRRMRVEYRRRRDTLVRALAERVPALHATGIAAGLHALIPLPPGGPTENEVLAHLTHRSIAVHGLNQYWRDAGDHDGGLVIGYATPPPHAFAASVRALMDALAELWHA